MKEERDPEDIDTPEQGLARFEGRFGNLAEFKQKALAEHKEQCTVKRCLVCFSPGELIELDKAAGKPAPFAQGWDVE